MGKMLGKYGPLREKNHINHQPLIFEIKIPKEGD
jgi:hypothetical protein